MLGLLLGIPLSLLPERYQRRWFGGGTVNFDQGTVFSGLIQIGIFGWLFFQNYMLYVQRGREAPSGVSGLYGVGFNSAADFIATWQGLLLAYFVAEGFARFITAFATNERMGTLPLFLLSLPLSGIEFISDELRYGARVPDEVESGDGSKFDMKISSCRPKAHWDHIMTVQYEDQFYEVTGQKLQGPPRRFVYLLRQKPSAKVIRGLHHYSPLEPLPAWSRQRQAKQQAASAEK